MKKILILIYMMLCCAIGVQAQTVYVNTPDTVCVSTASSTAGQTKYLSVNAMVIASGKITTPTNASWTITGPSGTAADYEVLYTGNTAATTKAGKLTNTKSLTLQFMQPGIYTLDISIPYSNNGVAQTPITRRKTIVAMDCTINVCGSNEANDKPGFFEDFGTMPAGVNRRKYPIDGVVTYDYQATGELADNYYTIASSTQQKPDWVDNTDHTGNTRGAMLVANSAYQPRKFYQKTITGLCRGAVYNFSAWLTNLNPRAVFEGTCNSQYQYAGVTFQVVNAANPSQVLANFPTYNVSMDLSNPKSSWQKYGGSFTVPPSVTDVIVQIINNKPGGCGNDIAIDDIEFVYCSPSITASIKGKTDNLAEVVCEGAPITLTSNYTPTDYFVNPAYQWEMSDDEGLTYTDVPFGTNKAKELVIGPGELKGTRNVPTSYRFRVRIYETGSNAVTCAAPSEYVRLTILPMPQLYLTKSQVCAGAFVELQASGGFDRFTWRDLPGYVGDTRTIEVLGDTTIMVYGYVDYADGHTCIDSNTAFISSVDAPIVEVISTSQNICAGSSVDIRINDAINNGTNQIRWFQGPDAGGTLTPLPDYDDMTTLSQVQINTPAEGVFTVVVSTPGNICRVQSAPFIINVTPIPVANAGPDQVACASTNTTGNFTMAALLGTGETGTWTIDSIWGPGAPPDTVGVNLRDYAQILLPTLRNTRVTVKKGGTSVRLKWTVKNSVNNACASSDVVVLSLVYDPSYADAGPDTTKCGTDNVFTMRASPPDASLTGYYAETGSWRLISGNATIANPSAYNTTVTSLVNEQKIVLEWTIRNAAGCKPSIDTVVLTKTTRPVITLRPITAICNTATSFSIDTLSTKGNPNIYTITTSALGGAAAMPGFVAISNDTIRAWPMTFAIPANTPAGNYNFNLSYRNSQAAGCDSTITFTVPVATPPTAPTAVAVGTPNICVTGSTTLTVTGGSLGTIPGGGANAVWRWYAGGCGTGTAIGTGPSITVNNITATTTYYVRAESTTGSCGNTACASATVTVYQQPTTANANADQFQCNNSSFTLNGNAPTLGTGAWSVVSSVPAGFTLTAAQMSNRQAPVTVTAGTTVTLRWTITNGTCSSSDDVVLRNDVLPTAVAGTNQQQCNNTAFTMGATAPTVGTGTWTLPAGSTATITAGQQNNPNAVINVPVGTSVVATWTVVNGTCSASSTVTLTNYAQPTATAGSNQQQCNITAFTMGATAPTVGTGTWSLPAGSAATITAGQQNNPGAVINVPVGTSVVATWTVVNGTCSASSTVTLTNYAPATTADAGKDQEQCNVAAFALAGNAPTVGTGAWSVVSSAPAGFTLTAAQMSNRNAAITIPVGTTVTLRWTITNGTCTSTDDVVLTNRPLPTTAAAGADQAQCNNTSFRLGANTPTVGTGAWSVISSTPGTYVFPAGSVNNPTATITVPVGSTVTLRWTITNGVCTSTDDVVLRNDAPPTTPNAGQDQSKCNTSSFLLEANAITVGTGAWSVVSSTPAGFIFPAASVNNPTATITVPAGTTVTLRWTATNGTCSAGDNVVLTNYAPVTTAAAGTDQQNCNNPSFTLGANAPTTGTGAWSVVSSVPAGYIFPAAQVNNRLANISVTAGTTVTLRWTITNGLCSSSDDVVVTNYVAPTAANAGPDQSQCNTPTFTMRANAASVGTGTWTLVPVVGTGATITGSVNSPTTTINVPAGVTVNAVWTITNGTCTTSDVVVLRNDVLPTAVAGSNQQQCNNTAFTMGATAPTVGTGTWTLPAGSTATITAGQQNNPNAVINVPVGTSVVATWTVVNGTCSVSSTVTLTNYAQPTATAGSNQQQCNITAFTMGATAPTVGTGTWSLPAGSTATITAGQQNNPGAVINVPVGTSVVATWTVVNGTCSASSTVTLTNYAPATTADAGKDQEQCNVAAFALAGNAPTVGTGAWSVVSSAPAGFTLTAAQMSNRNAAITIPVGTTVTLRWTITNGTCTSTDDVVLTNRPLPTTAAAGADQAQCNNTSFRLGANTPTVGTGAWSVISSTPGTYVFPAGSVNNPTATITVPVGSTVTLRWTITNGVCTSTDDVVLRNDAPPTTPDAGQDQSKCNTSSFQLGANAITVGTGAWSVVSSAPAGFIFPAASVNNPTAPITVPAGTTVTLRWTATNGTCTAYDDVVLTNYAAPAPANAGADQQECNNTSTFSLIANAPSVAGATGSWSVVSSTPVGYVFPAAQVNNPTAGITIPVGSVVTLRWTITNGVCSSTDDVTLTNFQEPNVADAGPDQEKCAGADFITAANAPTVAGATGAWTVISGNASIRAGEANNPVAHVTVPNGESAILRWTLTNGTCSNYDEVELTNYLTPAPAAAGADQRECNISTFYMGANAPDVPGATGTWTLAAGSPGSINAGDENNPSALINVPVGTTVTAIWTITNGTCPTADTVRLTNDVMPTDAAAGPDQEHCNDPRFLMAANAASVGTGKWSLTPGTTASFAVADSTNPNAVINVPAGVTVTATWTISNGVCITSDEVVLVNRVMPAAAAAGPDQAQCNTPAFTMKANNASVGTGKWNLVPGTTASFAVADSTNPSAVFNVPAGVTAQAVWIITNGVCETRDTVSLTNFVMPTTAAAGSNQAQCNTPAFTMNANAASVGTGKWSLIPVIGTGASFAVADSTNRSAVINVPAGVTVDAVWTISNGVCVTSDTVRLTNFIMPTTAAAGPDQAQCNTPAFRMAANVASVGAGKWSLVSVTGTGASFAVADSANRNAVINVPAGVTVDAVWTISNGVCVTRDTVRLTNFVAPAPANAGGDLTHCNDAGFVMSAQAPSVGTGKWSLVTVTGTGASFPVADSTNRSAVINVPAGVVVDAVWTITNGLCSTTDTVRLTNYAMPSNADAGPNQTHCDDDMFIMSANVPSPATARGMWTIVSGTATIIDPNNPSTTVRVASGQTVTLRWTITNGTCTSTPDDVVLVNQAAILGNTITADQLLCANETPGMLQGGTLTGGNGTFTYQWQVSTTNATTGFANVTVGGTNATFTPPMITRNTWYRRVVMSGACTGNISNAVMLTLMNIPPVVISVPGPLTVDCAQGTDYTQRFGTPVFSHAPYDNEPLSISHNDVTVTVDACTFTIMRTWTATDRCGLTTQAQQTITVVDRTAPVFTGTAPANITVECDQVPAAVNLTANDACNGTMTITPIEVRVDQPGACASNYQLIRKWVAVDGCGNASDTLRQVITVRDMTPPVFTVTAPTNITVDCDKVPAGDTLSATDNCTPGAIVVIPVDTRRNISGSKCTDNYQIIRTWTATDLCGNKTVLTQTITVQDTIKPRFSMSVPPSLTVDCDKVPSVETITATDNCTSTVAVRVTERRDNLSSSCTSSYRLTRTWTATDNCGNTNVMQQVITVQDTTRPVFVIAPPADTTVSCDAVPAPPTNLRATDNCSTVKIGYTQIRENIQGACASNYRLIRTWTAKDACNNTTVIRQVITITDTTRPVIDPAPASVTLSCSDAIPAAATLYARDNCDATFPKKATMVQDPFTVDLCNGYTITRRWTISDACGNQAIERVQTITVNPCPKPALDPNMPANCSNNTKFAVLLLNKVSRPKFTLVSVVPATAVPAPLTQSSNVFDLNGATQATFTVTDGVTGCVSDPVTYDLQYVPKPDVELGNDVTICQGSTVTLDAGAANAAYPIRWSTGATTQTINVNTAGTYYATVTNGICATTDSVKVIVNMPPVVNIRDTAICQGENLTLNAYVEGGSYVWSTGATTASITVNTTGTYSVDVTVNGCTTHAEAVVLVGTPPAVVLTDDMEICPNETALLTVDPDGGSILWSNGETTNSIVVSRPGDYTVTVTRDGCVVTDKVTVTQRPDLDIDLGPDREFCNGGRVVVDATHPDAISYLWNDGDTNPVKEITGAGKYIVSVMDRFCSRITMDSVNVTVAGIPAFDLGRDTLLCIGEDLTLKVNPGSGNQVRWQDGSTSLTYKVTTPGTYTVTVSNDCGSMSDQIVVRYQACEPKPQFPTGFTPNGDGHNDVFKPIVRGPMYDYDLRIYNRWGELIFLSKDQKNGWDGRYKGALVENGTYVWMLSYKKVLGGAVNVVKGEVTAIR
ncbi:HYR-like domain-containing protein [Chitinophaga agri]|uniref:T9SS type B sorting domain-containing protein n=1 Tax=Chitinophaga agri TaxID=2703787 RepID=A0A6B9Z9K2_9BACT|nr:gliding motility-associated C-terminal domain-containing protein [Chitinophaga agri]QHS58920.1 T9SS type B sorting domain-containing protein [Chitinophaga agri]